MQSVKADLSCTRGFLYVMDSAFVTNLYYIKYSEQLKGLCHEDIVVLYQFCAFSHTKQCSSRIRKIRKHQGAQTIVYFLVILAGTALKLENVGPTFPCFASDPSNRRQENKVVNNKIRPLLLEFNSNKDTFLVFQKESKWYDIAR